MGFFDHDFDHFRMESGGGWYDVPAPPQKRHSPAFMTRWRNIRVSFWMLSASAAWRHRKTDEEIQKAIQQFALKYGLFGLMNALPTTPNFMDYKAVYLPKNHLMKEECPLILSTRKAVFPFTARRRRRLRLSLIAGNMSWTRTTSLASISPIDEESPS